MAKTETISDAEIAKYAESYPYYSEHHLKIITKKAEVIPFVHNRVQRRLNEWFAEDENLPEGIRWLILKARQATVSTWVAGKLHHRQVFKSPRNGLVVSYDDDSVAYLFEMQQLFYTGMPAEIKPDIKYFNRGKIHFDNPDPKGERGLNSRMVVATAGKLNLGRSFTIHDFEGSEVAAWANPKQIFVSLFPSIPNLPGTFVVLESTAQGEGWFKDRWYNEDSWRRIFIPAIACEEYRAELPKDFYVEKVSAWGNEVEEYDDCAEQMPLWYPELKTHNPDDLIEADRIILQHLAWRRKKITEEFDGDFELFRQEYPNAPSAAFVGSGAAVFDNKILKSIELDLRKRPIEKIRLHFDLFAVQRSQIDPNWWQLEKAFTEQSYGEVYIYEEAQAQSKYVLAGDPSEGIRDGENPGIQVFRLPEMIEVAACMEILDATQIAELSYCLARYYNNAYTGIEANNYGQTTIRRLQDLGYNNQYLREYFDNVLKKRMMKYGWHTSSSTKPFMIDCLRAAIRRGEIIFSHLETLKQLQYYQFQFRKDGTIKGMEYTPGQCACFVITSAIAIQLARNVHVGDGIIPSTTVVGSFDWYANKARRESFYRSRRGSISIA